MNKNVGQIDKVIRLVVALILFSLYFVLDGSSRYLALIGIIPLGTALMNFCPLYTVFKINTGKK